MTKTLRQSEDALARAVRIESEPIGDAVLTNDRTAADDCAVMLEARFERLMREGRWMAWSDVVSLAASMRALGSSQAGGKL